MSRKGADNCLASSKDAPYLHAALRELHRLANPNAWIPMKHIHKEITVLNGVNLPATVIVLDGYSSGLREEFCGPDPLDLNPRRFLRDAVQNRQGATAAAN